MKKGDIVLCKKDYNTGFGNSQRRILYKKGEFYKIEQIKRMPAYLQYSGQELEDWVIFENQEKTFCLREYSTYNFYYEYFYSTAEMRKFKLDNINLYD